MLIAKFSAVIAAFSLSQLFLYLRPLWSLAINKKKAALDYYLTYGKSISLTREILGYPKAWNCLARWIDELAPGQRRLVKQNTFTMQQKQDAVEELITRTCIAQGITKRVRSSKIKLSIPSAITHLISRKGCSPDNSAMEGFF